MNESLTYKTEKRIYDFLPHEPEKMATVLFVIGMAIYYLWRMFAITPQYDELYTYYNYICRGPLNAAFTWNDANNHVGYSLFSAIADFSGNSFIGLRGVSYICAVSNLILVNRICARYYSHWIPFGAMMLYGSMQIVNEYSVQGRGYTLSATCFLIAVYSTGFICTIEDTKPLYFISICLSFFLGMYVLPASFYWILSVIVAISVYLLFNAYRSRKLYATILGNGYFKKFIGFLKSTFTAACITAALYCILWISIGSKLLIGDEASPFFGLERGTVLVRAPVSSLVSGLKYMIGQPYVRSYSVDEFKRMYFGWNFALADYMLPGLGILVVIIVIFSIIMAAAECIRHFAYSRTVINLMMISNILVPAGMLTVSHKLPYHKTFVYSAFVVVLSFATFVEMLVNVAIRLYNRSKQQSQGEQRVLHKENETALRDENKWYSGIGIYIHVLVIVIFFCYRALSPDFSRQLGDRENDLFNTLYIADVGNRHNPAVLDCDQQYLLKFGWGIDCNKTDVLDSDCVIIDKDMLEPGVNADNAWKFYQDYNTIDWDYIYTMHPIYENENFILYVK